MKKVLFLIHALGGGGAEKILINLVRAMDRNKYDITIATVVDSGIHRAEIPRNVHYKSLFVLPGSRNSEEGGTEPSGSGSLLANAGVLKRGIARLYTCFWRWAPTKLLYSLFLDDDYDVEIAFLEGICTKLIAYSPNEASKKIAWLHVDIQSEKKSHGFYRSLSEEKDCYERFDRVCAVSKGVADSFKRYFQGVTCVPRVTYNPIDIDEIHELSSADVELDQFFFDRDVPTFLSVGRLCPQKAFHRIVEIAAMMKSAGEHAHFAILGEGPNRAELEEEIRRLGVEDAVHLLGFKSNPYPFFMAADCYLCSSIAEGFSTTVTEATVFGLPIISTACAGMEEIADVYSGITICSNDFESLHACIADFVDLWKASKVKRGEYRVDHFFDIENRVAEVEGIIDELLA